MANFVETKAQSKILAVSRREALDIVALLTGQLAGLPAPGCMAGAAPVLMITGDDGMVVKRFVIVLKPDKP